MARFKELLANPPMIERMVFAEILPKIPNKAVPLDTGIAGSTNRAWYELCWQPRAMVLKSLGGPNELKHPILGFGFSVWEDRFFFLGGSNHASVYVMEHDKAKNKAMPGPYHAALILMNVAAEPMNLGLSHLLPGQIRWDGERFEASGTADKKAMAIRGAITKLTNAIPCELRVQYSNNMGVAHYRMEYEYAPYAPPYYPSRITQYFRYHDREIVYCIYEIQSVVLAAQPLPESYFDPRLQLAAPAQPLRYLTNDSIYFQLPSGEWIESPAAAP